MIDDPITAPPNKLAELDASSEASTHKSPRRFENRTSGPATNYLNAPVPRRWPCLLRALMTAASPGLILPTA